MKNVKILDCTLRDGGYINNWNFGENAIKDIIERLKQTGTDIIECGFIRDIAYNRNLSVFSSVEQITRFITPKSPGKMYVAMIALGDIEPERVENCNASSIDGIRLTFHKDELEREIQVAFKLQEKGYKVFIQPVGTAAYSDQELLDTIERVNILNPFAFYIVDTLGTMYKKDLLHVYHLIDNNLQTDIAIGFHSHNNLQLSFANAQSLLDINTNRHIIIDSSVFGMGRRAGNLPTELITQYINDNVDHKYNVIPLLSIIDEHLNPIYAKSKWGYTAPYYLAAVAKCHPDYATYLMSKGHYTLF